MAQYSANFNQAKVLVLGDVMLDRYWFGATNRISPKHRFLWLEYKIMKSVQVVQQTWR